ncbi:Polysaccharide deacetylase [Lunatimonas lonarensis]|uniref:Polysaccharide deacetylase n=1 Tax=Lunatimonas lonarensis TaxID=1232681 RepID=R7ZZ93_9BACT|nr:Polysaccharide deacetylase [Lunatimonas lonarensis]
MPRWVQLFCPELQWHGDRANRKIYLTFDDGPVAGITDFVLEELAKRDCKATFFMVGDNVARYVDLAREVVDRGHQVGNHTFHHLNGIKVSTEEYLRDVRHCQEELNDTLGVSPKIFRPPYGLLKPKQKHLLLQDFRLVYWEIVAGDYLLRLSPEKILENLKTKTRPGSIVLFHDQQKTAAKLKRVLPDFLTFLDGEGFVSDFLPI